ncbi:hypothetical protein ACROSR_14845 [Roseovarius tibetensis]|uniref:hypothetical protein n=1 Tax=Roseovarius tibetensis TaxID=2685897 RepID=UPI003D7FAB49
MDAYLLPGLALITLVIVAATAYRSKRATEQRLADEKVRKSALADNGDPHKKAP